MIKKRLKPLKYGKNILEVIFLKRKKKMKPGKKIFISFFIALSLWILGFYLYGTYQNIDINGNNYTAERLQSTDGVQTVEKIEEESKNIADILEETTKKVVGISKLKDAGNTILSKSTESELGLGTGFIVTSDGYIVSNEHVTGEKFSKCYITLENGNNYDGTVIWSDKDLDLSIVKIKGKDLPYVTLGDSSNIRVGETVYAIRKSNRI